MSDERELDALVAEHVMRWRRVTSPAEYSRAYAWYRVYDDGPRRGRQPQAHTVTTNGKGTAPSTVDTWMPSERIADAIFAAESLASGHRDTFTLQRDGGKWSAFFRLADKGKEPYLDAEGHAYAKTGPLAICLAALRAAGVSPGTPPSPEEGR